MNTALDVLCAKETVRDIFDAMTPQQFVVAALLVDGMTIKQIAAKLKLTHWAICVRRNRAQERVARTMMHVHAEHLHGDVISREWWRNGSRGRRRRENRI